MARRSVETCRQLVVSVVGVSGGEREKGVTGVGKSCFCNRFIRPQADNYHIDHISVLSQTDFSGRVVNNDHFLYWGEVARTSEDNTDYNFQVIEQTEFIDDASFMPFKAGKMDPYIKRCCSTKIQSAEKLMYICKNQLGIEKEYDQKVLPDGKLNVDGFLCVFDVSQVPNRSLDRMVEMTATILSNCVKTKRPVVLVTTKNDEANEVYMKEAEKLCCRKEFKGNIPLVETSAHENVNVDSPFLTLAQLVDRNRGKIRIVPFFEAARHRKEILDVASDMYLRLVKGVVTDYRTVWSSASKRLVQHTEFAYYVDLFGIDSAARLFRRHTKRLKDEFLQRKVEAYMGLLPSILREFFPDLQTLQDGYSLRTIKWDSMRTRAALWDWLTIQQRISEHIDFDRYFIRGDDDIPWSENFDLLDSPDTRIPFSILDSNEAETVFKNHVNALQAELEMREMRDRFKMLLSETGYVTPGKKLDEVRVLFMGRESFDSLSEHDRQIIYDQHQKDITEKARSNFLELLLEHAELFYHVKSIVPSGTITQDDIREITLTLQEDNRYKSLDRLESERTLLLLQHLGFVHCPKKEHCPAYPQCTDIVIEKMFLQQASNNCRPGSGSWGRKGNEFASQQHQVTSQVKLILLAINGLARDIQDTIRSFCDDDEFELDNRVVSLDYRIVGDVSLPQNPFKTPDFAANGVICAYCDEIGLDFIRESLEKALVTQLEREEPTPHPPTTILFTPGEDLDQNTVEHLHDEGANLADSLQCNFIDAGLSVGTDDSRKFDSSLVSKALRSLIISIEHRSHSLSIFNHSVGVGRETQPDIRIIMCILCGDPFPLENVLNPLLSHQWAVVSGERSISLHAFLDECKRKVEVVISSYHGANAFREDLVHGFILVYSTKRKASLTTLRAFSANIPNLPIQILAVTDTNPASAFFGSDTSQQLITEGNSIADRLQAHFMTTTASCQQKSAFYTPFFKEVWEKKPEIEQAFNMVDPLGLDDSGEGTLERPPHHLHRHGMSRPVGGFPFTGGRRNLPPRSQSAEGSSSEIYETVPTDGSLGDDLDDPASPTFPEDQPLTPSDDSDIYSHIDNDEEEHLVKPSQLKKQQRFPQELLRESFPSTESLPTTTSSRSKVSPHQSTDLEHTTNTTHPFPPIPPYPPPPPSTPPPCYSLISRDSPPSSQQPLLKRDSRPTAPPPPYSLQPRTLPHPPPRHRFLKMESHSMDHPTNDDNDHPTPSSSSLPQFAELRDANHSSPGGSGGGLQVYPPPTTPPEPAPPDRECLEGPPLRRLVKATTLPAPSLHSNTSRTSLEDLTCWADDSINSRRLEEYWVDTNYGPHMLTTGRRGKIPPPPPRLKPKTSQTLKQPGKLNLRDYSNVTEAINKISLKDGASFSSAKLTKTEQMHAPLATPESMDCGSEYAMVKDAVPGLYFDGEYSYSRVPEISQAASAKARQRQRREKGRQAYSDSDSDWSSPERRNSQDAPKGGNNRKAVPKRMKKKRIPIPVATPRVPPLPSLYTGEGGGPNSRYAEERVLLDPSDRQKVFLSGSDDCEASDEELQRLQPSLCKGGFEPIKRRMPPTEVPFFPSFPSSSSPYSFSAFLSPPLTSRLLSDPPQLLVATPSSFQPYQPPSENEHFFSPFCKDGDTFYRVLPDDDSSIEVSSPREPQSPVLTQAQPSSKKENEKTGRRKEKQKSKEEARLREEEKKRTKEEEKLRKEKEREKKKSKASSKGTSKGPPEPSLEELVQSSEHPLPLLVEKCVKFIEAEGLDSEGIYRVPGNKMHVEQLLARFKEEPTVSFAELDIPVNAAATALKDHLKQLPPLLPQSKMEELTTIAGIGDRSCRLLKLKEMLTSLPRVNFEILKFIFQHFVKVAENCKLNSMDSKNLAICWWPTLLHTLQFSDIAEFESKRPHIEDIIQTMIDQFPFLFQGKEDYVMV